VTRTTFRTPLALAAATAVALVLAATALSRSHATPTLTGTIGPGYTIKLTMNSKVVKTLKAGTYKLVIHDMAPIHAFSLDGPNGYAKDFTTVPFVGTKTFTVKLKAGKYKYYCPPHEPVMFGRFTATT
jgi:plastocyanin